MELKLSVQAEEDIIAIAEHGIAMFGPIQAKRYHSDLFNTLDLIAKNPQMAREREEISPPVRIHPFKAHLVIYQIWQKALKPARRRAFVAVRFLSSFDIHLSWKYKSWYCVVHQKWTVISMRSCLLAQKSLLKRSLSLQACFSVR